MISAFANTWKIPELRSRILFTLGLIIIIRLGVHITLPGVDTGVIQAWLDDMKNQDPNSPTGGMTALLNVFSGGGLQQAGIFALGIMPYISASIMVQLLTAVVPKLSRLAREDGGRQQINQYTRYITLGIAIVQGFFLAKTLASGRSPLMHGVERFGDLVANATPQWYVLTTLTIVAGTVLLLWIADQITDRGIGNGASVIITVNIISGLPAALIQAWKYFVVGTQDGNPFNAMKMVVLIILLVVVIAGTVAITQAQRRITVQYAKRVVGRKQFGGQTQYLPLKVNYSGVMPIIFASAILGLPVMMLSLIPSVNSTAWFIKFSNQMNGGYAYYIIAGIGIFLFSYFWVAMMFQPSQIAEDLKRNGGYVPGVRPGKPTSDFLDFTMTRLTFAGAVFLTFIFMLPAITGYFIGLNPGTPILHFFGGTSLLILVGVILDVMRQVETQLIQRHYDGFLRKGKLKGRYDRLAQQGGNAASSSAIVFIWAIVAVLVVLGITAYIYNRVPH